MANTTISQLPMATALSLDAQIEIVQNGTSYRTTLGNILGMATSNTPAYFPPQSWDGSAINLQQYQTSVNITCTVAPTTPPTVQVSPDGAAWVTVSDVANTSTGYNTQTTISAVGDYSVPSGLWLRLNGSVGGTYFLRAS